ncbi:hypothetical protein ABN028_20150 [Actinopolymorpha sp. B17G11]|uniref:hypothetical protein n=1 Tax=Actinopolymorpha sp. B17G11 TaxID=3160861 RepID=UPI0032E39025
MTPSISARQAARHLRALIGAGMTMPQISGVSGVAVRVVQDVVSGRQNRVLRATAERLLAVTNPAPGPVGSVPSIGVLRRIQGLLAMGWRHRDLDLRTGLDTRTVLYRGHGWVPSSVHLAVSRVYDKLSMTPGPCARTRDTARAAGYAPPLAWDDDTIDAPAVLPNLHGDGQDAGVDEAAVLRRIAGDRVPVTPAEAAEVVARMRRAGLPDAAITRITRLRTDRYAPLQRDLNRAA